MPTWFELERRFRDLAGGLVHAVLERHVDNDGSDRWRLIPGADPLAGRNFRLLSRMAGQKLLEECGDELDSDLASAASPEECWYRSLTTDHRLYKQDGYVVFEEEDGRKRVRFYGSIDRPAEASASKCLELATMSDESKRPESAAIVIQNNKIYGEQARLNVASTDTSNNAIQGIGAEFLRELREAIERDVDDEERKVAILARLDALEAQAGRPQAHQAFRELLEMAANWMTIISPFLPQLTALLPRS